MYDLEGLHCADARKGSANSNAMQVVCISVFIIFHTKSSKEGCTNSNSTPSPRTAIELASL